MLKDLCNLASSESDRLLIKYACCKGQNLSSNDSSKIYGFTNFTKQETKINEAISSLREVREAVDMLATVKDKAILEGFGLTISSDEDSLKDESCSDSEAECNWISEGEDCVSRVGTSPWEQESGERANSTLEEEEDKVVTDTESDNPDDWLNVDIQKKVKQRRYLNKKKHERIFAKKKAEQQLLKRKVPKVVSRVVMPKVFTWLHRGFARPSVTPFVRDGVHLNKIGQYNLYRSYRGAILKSLHML